MPVVESLVLRGSHITLDVLLKAQAVAVSGGEAKRLIAVGAVRVNDVVETRRGRKLRAGDRITVGSQQIRVAAADDAAASASPLSDSGLGL